MDTKTCNCGNYLIPDPAPHTVHGCDPAVIDYQVVGAPQYGREAHTVRECYREVCADESWALALKEWKESLGDTNPLPAPMPVGHIMFDAIPGSPALSRRDNNARKAAQAEGSR